MTPAASERNPIAARAGGPTTGIGGGALARWATRLFRIFPGAESSAGCRGCGKCCDHFGGHLRASKADLERWREEGRADLLGRVNRLGWLWVDPDSGRPVGRCPFLERDDPESARCRIHETKPDMCRAYPTLAHGSQCVRGIVVH